MWPLPRRRDEHADDRPRGEVRLANSTLSEQTEAFIHGHLHTLRGDSDPATVCWLRLNQLAHGSLPDLRTLADDNPPRDEHHADPGWSFVLACLALKVLRRASTDDDLRQLQRALLWPLESDLIEARSAPVSTPQGLFRETTRALEPTMGSSTPEDIG